MAITDDFPANATTTGAIAIGISDTGAIESPEDADWFKTQLIAGTAYTFTLTGISSAIGKLGDGSGTAYLSLYSPTGELITATGITTPLGETVLSFAASSSGTYYLGVSELSGTGDGAYRLAMDYANLEDDYAANASTAAVVQVDGSVSGMIEVPTDSDWFKASLSVGTVYMLAIEGSNSGVGTLGAGAGVALLSLYSPTGEFIGSTTQGAPSGDPAMLFAPTHPGAHYLAVSAVGVDTTGTYRVSVDSTPTASSSATTGADYLVGTSGADTLDGLGGDDVLDGRGGTDAARFTFGRAAYQIENSGPVWRIRDTLGSGGTDTLLSIESLEFSDATFGLVEAPRTHAPDYAQDVGFLFDSVYYLLSNPGLVPTVTLDTALQHYLDSGASRHLSPNVWFESTYYASKWPDLAALQLDDATLFMHYNLYGVWEGRSAGSMFDHFDGNRYLTENQDVAAYVDANLDSFLGSRSNGAIAHFIIYGADEQRIAYDTGGAMIDMGYVLN